MADAPVVEAPLDDGSPLGQRKRPAEGGYTEARKLQALSLEAGWAGVIAASPTHGPRLRQLMAP